MRDTRHIDEHHRLERRATHRDEGFSLMELLFVVILLGILASIVVGVVSGVTTEAAESGCGADRYQIRLATEAYLFQMDTDQVPATGITNDRHELTLVESGFLRGASNYYDLDADGIITTQENSPC